MNRARFAALSATYAVATTARGSSQTLPIVRVGTIPIDKVVGRAVFVMWPKEHWKGLRVPTPVEQFATPASGAMGAVPFLGAVALVLPLAGLRARRRRRLRRTAA